VAEILICLPGSNVIVDYADQAERDGSLRLAEARQQIAHEGVIAPTWAELTDYEREMATLEARSWLRAAARAGLLAATEREHTGPQDDPDWSLS
jgi:hypothetical protein